MARTFKDQSIAVVAGEMKRHAQRFVYDGMRTPQNARLMNNCSAHDYNTNTALVFARDWGHHSRGGGFKSPEADRCFHLSLAFADPDTRQVLKTESALVTQWIRSFFGKDLEKVWAEAPGNDGLDLIHWHFRLFTDELWRPLEEEPIHMERELRKKGWVKVPEISFEFEEPRVPNYFQRLWKRLWIVSKE